MPVLGNEICRNSVKLLGGSSSRFFPWKNRILYPPNTVFYHGISWFSPWMMITQGAPFSQSICRSREETSPDVPQWSCRFGAPISARLYLSHSFLALDDASSWLPGGGIGECWRVRNGNVTIWRSKLPLRHTDLPHPATTFWVSFLFHNVSSLVLVELTLDRMWTCPKITERLIIHFWSMSMPFAHQNILDW